MDAKRDNGLLQFPHWCLGDAVEVKNIATVLSPIDGPSTEVIDIAMCESKSLQPNGDLFWVGLGQQKKSAQ